MRLLNFFTTKVPSNEQIENQTTRLKEKYAKPEYRQTAMKKLLKWNTDKSLEAVLKRFQVSVNSPYWDEKEKSWLVESLMQKGSRLKNILIDTVKSENHLSYILIIIKHLVTEDEFIEIVKNGLLLRSPQDYKSSESKIELILALQSCEATDIKNLLIKYLEDCNDGVVCAALSALTKQKNKETCIKLNEMLINGNYSARVLQEVALALNS